MKIFSASQHHPNANPQGFASILTVISVGLALLILLLFTYRDTLQSQKTQSHILLRNDYIQREDAFLRALTNIIPNKTMRGMMDDSDGDLDLSWTQIMADALTQANVNQAMNDGTITTLDLASKRSANTADSTIDAATVIHSVFTEGNLISSGTNSAGGSNDYPALLTCSSSLNTDDSTSPVISYLKTTSSGSNYEKILAPELNFKYQSNTEFIAKHNWWTFDVSFAEQDTDATNLIQRSKRYLVSLYEVPAQLAINSASFTNFGQHDDGSDWSSITTTGGVFAGKVKATGSFSSSDGVASRQGVELADASNPLASDNTARNNELYKGDASISYSSSSDGGHVAFVPILPVLGSHITAGDDFDLYDDYLNGDEGMIKWTENGSNQNTKPVNKLFYTRTIPVKFEQYSSNAVSDSATAWRYYSRGANQCKMILIDNASGTSEFYIDIENDDTPKSMELIIVNSNEVFTAAGDDLEVNVGNLIDYLASISIDMTTINSLCVNTTRGRVIFRNAKSFVSGGNGFSNGFSIVTNKRLVLDEDVNNDASPIPLSMYAPEVRYGSNIVEADIAKFKIKVDGALGSLAEKTKNDDAVNIADLKIKYTPESNNEDIEIIPTLEATLTSITELDDLPPINMMNWMIVVREIHPKIIPAEE